MATGSPEQIEEERRHSRRRHDTGQASPSFDPASSLFSKPTASLRRLLRLRAAQPIHSGHHSRSFRMPDLAPSPRRQPERSRILRRCRCCCANAGDVALRVRRWRLLELVRGSLLAFAEKALQLCHRRENVFQAQPPESQARLVRRLGATRH
jgi:hypothetical protein